MLNVQVTFILHLQFQLRFFIVALNSLFFDCIKTMFKYSKKENDTVLYRPSIILFISSCCVIIQFICMRSVVHAHSPPSVCYNAWTNLRYNTAESFYHYVTQQVNYRVYFQIHVLEYVTQLFTRKQYQQKNSDHEKWEITYCSRKLRFSSKIFTFFNRR